MHKKIKLDDGPAASPASRITDENVLHACSSSVAVPVPVVGDAAIVDKDVKDTEAIAADTKAMETNDQDEEEEEEEEEEEDEDEEICLDILGNAALALEEAFVVDGTYPCTKVEIDFLDSPPANLVLLHFLDDLSRTTKRPILRNRPHYAHLC